MIPDLKPEMQELIQNISNKNMYSGNKIPDSVMRLFEIEETEHNIGILVPYWISVLQRGRGPRRSTKDSGLSKIIYRWMEKHNMFRSATPRGKMNEAKSLTWYINKYGNKHFRSGRFIDIYETARQVAVDKIMNRFSLEIGEITKQVI